MGWAAERGRQWTRGQETGSSLCAWVCAECLSRRRILEHLNRVGKSEPGGRREVGSQLNKSDTFVAVSLVPRATAGAGRLGADLTPGSRFHGLCPRPNLTTVFPSQPAAFTAMLGPVGSSSPTEGPTSRNLFRAPHPCSSPSGRRQHDSLLLACGLLDAPSPCLATFNGSLWLPEVPPFSLPFKTPYNLAPASLHS